MVENKTRKIERDEIIVCGVCNNSIAKELLDKSVGGINNLYCQYCGVSLNLTPDPIDIIVTGESPTISSNTQKEYSLTNIKHNSQESDFALSHSNIRNALRSYIFQLIYQLLKSTPLTLKKIQNKKELKSSHINIVLKKIWKELKDLNLNNLANQELISSKRRIKNYFGEFQSTLRPYKQFRKNNFALFAENIEFVFGLILGDYNFSNLTTSKKRIVLDLKKNFGFKSDTATTNSFTYNISLIISKKIHSILNQYHISEGNDNKLALDEIISYVIDYIVNIKVKSSDLSEFNSSKKKKFHRTLKILIDNLKTDWIYRKSFEDHIYKLTLIVSSLTSDADYPSRLTGFERLISQGMKESALFERDQDFSAHFKLNYTLILCRIIYLKIKKSPKITKLKSQSVNLSLADENLIKNFILDEIIVGKKINSQILKKFYKLSLEEFQTYYEKLQNKLTSDLIYVESFRDYIRDLVKLVFNIVHSISKKSHLTQLELAVIKDLESYNFDCFYKGEEWSKLERRITDVPVFYMGVRDRVLKDQGKDNLAEKNFDENKQTHSTLQSYSTIEFLQDIMSELQSQPEALAKIFPQRVHHFSQFDFSQFWKGNNKFIDGKVYYKRKVNPNYEIKENNLYILEKKVIDRFGANSLGLIEILRQYRSEKITMFEFFENFQHELGRVSGEIKVSQTELSLLFGMSHNYISLILHRIEDRSNPNYNPDFAFSKEVLNGLVENLDVLKYSFRNALDLIEKFKTLNPDLKEYSGQQYTITNPTFFSDILQNPTEAYWLGFLSADGYMSDDGRYAIGTELSVKDEDHLKKFGEVVGYEESRIFHRAKIVRYKSEIKIFESRSIAFCCKPMHKTLEEIGLLRSKSERDSVPSIIQEAIELAKKEMENTNTHWSETTYGKVAHAWLLGFYDGDGSYTGKTAIRSKYGARIFAASEALLNQIKDLFEIKNNIYSKIEPGDEVYVFDKLIISKGFYYVTLGTDVFKRILQSYDNSLDRKRP